MWASDIRGKKIKQESGFAQTSNGNKLSMLLKEEFFSH